MADSPIIADIRVFDRIDIDRFSERVSRPPLAPRCTSAVEGRSIVRFDRLEVAAAVVADQAHFPDRVVHVVKVFEDPRHLFGDAFVDDQLSGVVPAVESPVGEIEIAEVPQGDGQPSR